MRSINLSTLEEVLLGFVGRMGFSAGAAPTNETKGAIGAIAVAGGVPIIYSCLLWRRAQAGQPSL